MKAITIWQPWASLIMSGRKAIETRTHDRFKGLVGQRIAIHAGRRWDTDCWRAMVEAAVKIMEATCKAS